MMNADGLLDLITHQDLRLMRRVQRWRAPRWVRLWMILATRAGDGWLWYAQAPVILIYGGQARYLGEAAAALGAAVSVGAFQALKRKIGRKRPCALGLHSWAKLLPPDQFSFPSGHTMTAFAVSVPLIHFYPELLPVLLFCSLSIAASRLLLGMHFLSDVLAGVALGCLLGYLSWVVV